MAQRTKNQAVATSQHSVKHHYVSQYRDDHGLHSFPTRRSSDLARRQGAVRRPAVRRDGSLGAGSLWGGAHAAGDLEDRKSTRLNSSHVEISYAVLCLKKKTKSLTTHCSILPKNLSRT